jgi:hypothetical protein
VNRLDKESLDIYYEVQSIDRDLLNDNRELILDREILIDNDELRNKVFADAKLKVN